MKIYSITVDTMPKSCGDCPLCGYTNDYSYFIREHLRKRREGKE